MLTGRFEMEPAFTDVVAEQLAAVDLNATTLSPAADLDQFCARYNAGNGATIETDGCTLGIVRLPDGRLHVYLDSDSNVPLCFTIKFLP